MSGIDDMLKTIGIAAIGIFAIGVVLCFLSAMCLLVAVFTYTSMPDVPTVTIGPVEAPITAAPITAAPSSTTSLSAW